MMRDDELLHALGDLGRADDPLDDPMWEDVAAGRADEAALAALRGRFETAEAFDRALSLFTPLGAPALEKMEKMVARGKPVAPVSSLEATRTRKSRRRPVLIAASTSVALAASALLAFSFLGQEIAPGIPAYRLELTGGDVALRGAELERKDDIRLERDSLVTVSLRPETRPQTGVTARSYLVEGSGAAHALDARLDATPSGVLRLEGTAGDLFGDASGDFDLVLAVAAAGTEPPSPSEVAEAVRRGTSLDGWQVFSRRVTLVGR